jgi:class 3 adenylate cyclase
LTGSGLLVGHPLSGPPCLQWRVVESQRGRHGGPRHDRDDRVFNREPDRAGKPRIEVGIGIASGDVLADYSTQQRATYTCVGDAVKVAARLEAHTKMVGQSVLVDGATRSGLAQRCTFEPLGALALKGKAQAVEVFAVVCGQNVQ